MATTTSTTTVLDQEKFLAVDLIKRSYQKLVAASLCDKVKMPKGAGLTANFVRYKRVEVPLNAITEGSESGLDRSIELSTVTVTLEQWGDIMFWTDVAEMTGKHALPAQVMKLLADSAARVMDREVQVVMLANTNAIYGDGVVTTRNTITSSMKINDALINKAIVQFTDRGVPPRGGPAEDSKQVQASGDFRNGQKYVAVCGPQVMANIRDTGTSLGTWVSVAMYANQKALYNAEVGEWLGVRWVETNFIPKFTYYGNTSAAVGGGAGTTNDAGGMTGLTVVIANAGGTLGNATFYWKVARIDNLRGFEEHISMEHSSATGGATSQFTFTFPSTAGYSYVVYFGSVTGDSNLKRVAGGPHAASASVVVTAVPSSGTPPQSLNTATTPNAVHPVYLLGEEAMNWVGFYNIEVRKTSDSPIIGNVLGLKKAAGYKFFGKAMVRDTDRLLRIEVASSY